MDLHVFLEIAVAELEDHVVVVRAFHHLVHSDDVGGFDLLQDLDLLHECPSEILIGVDCVLRGVLSILVRTLIAKTLRVDYCSPL